MTAGSRPSRSLEQVDALLKTHSLGDFLPYVSYDEASCLFYGVKGCGFVLETLPLVGVSAESERQLRGVFQHTLPAGSSLQFLLVASHRIEEWLTPWQQARSGEGEVLKKLAQQRVDHLRKLALSCERGTQRIRTFRLIISWSQGMKPTTPLEEKDVVELRDQLISTLEGLGLPVKVWTSRDLLTRLDEILNVSNRLDTPPLTVSPYDPLNQQLMSSSSRIQVSKDGLGMNDAITRTYSVRSCPTLWSLWGMDSLIGRMDDQHLTIPGDFMIHYGVQICDETTLKGRMTAKCQQVDRQASSPLAKWFPELKKEAEEWNYVRHKFEEGQRLVRTRLQVVLTASPEDMGRCEQSLFNLYRSCKWELTPDSYFHLPSLISCLPLTWGEGSAEDNWRFKKSKLTLSHEPANILPILGEWQGTATPGMLLAGRRGQLFYWYPFDSASGNFNCAVVGRSGAGKSVFMEEFVASLIGQGGRVFILDVGRSFERTVLSLGGEVIQFSHKTPLSLNPFSTINASESEEVEHALTMLKSVVALMASPLSGVSDDEMVMIEKALKTAWEAKGSKASMTTVADLLLESKNPMAQALGERLYPYTASGFYGRYFEGPATVNLSNRLLVFEFEELKGKKDLQSVILQMVILQITNQVYLGDRKCRPALIIDEAWDLLRGNQSKEFIETAARRLRKYGGSLVTGTQSVNDFYSNPSAQAAFENSDWMCLLSQKAESIEQLKQSGRLMMDASMEAMMKSVHTQQGQYSEVMIVGSSGYAIGRLLLDPFSNILYSTKAEDYVAVKRLEEKGLSLSDAIGVVSQEKAA